jgi:hypothetical protein
MKIDAWAKIFNGLLAGVYVVESPLGIFADHLCQASLVRWFAHVFIRADCL